jgi:transcriptional regulator with XRE-family HTH domain
MGKALSKKGYKMTLSYQAIMRIYGRAAEHNISAGKLAAAAGLSRVTLSNWKCQRSTPMLEAYLAVEKALDELISDKIRSRPPRSEEDKKEMWDAITKYEEQTSKFP